jgi:hypothetical protein
MYILDNSMSVNAVLSMLEDPNLEGSKYGLSNTARKILIRDLRDQLSYSGGSWRDDLIFKLGKSLSKLYMKAGSFGGSLSHKGILDEILKVVCSPRNLAKIEALGSLPQTCSHCNTPMHSENGRYPMATIDTNGNIYCSNCIIPESVYCKSCKTHHVDSDGLIRTAVYKVIKGYHERRERNNNAPNVDRIVAAPLNEQPGRPLEAMDQQPVAVGQVLGQDLNFLEPNQAPFQVRAAAARAVGQGRGR